MNKRIASAAAVPILCGMAAAAYGSAEITLCFMAAFLYLIYPAVRKRSPGDMLLRGILVLSLFFLSFFYAGSAINSFNEKMRQFNKGQELMETLKIEDISVDSLTLFCGETKVYLGEKTDLYIGDVIEVRGVCFPFEEATNEGQFDSVSYNLSMGFTHALYVENARDIKRSVLGGESLLGFLHDLRILLSLSFDRGLSEENSAVMKAMAAGDRSFLDTETKELFSDAGLSHILVVSGLHISLIGMGIFRLLRRFFGIISSATASMTIVALYTAMTGFGVSGIRAVLMFAVFMVAEVIGRGYDGIASLSTAICLMLIHDPKLILSTGFILSIYQTFMIISLSVAVKKKNLFSLMIPLMGYPVTAAFFFELPVYSPILNLLVLPLMGAELCGGMIGGLLGIFFPGLGNVILLPVGFVLDMDLALVRFFTELPGGKMVCGVQSFTGLLSAFILLYVLFCLLKKRERYLYCLSAYPVMFFILSFGGKHGMRIEMLDVGQGDGIYIETAEGSRLFVDGGSTDVKNVGKYRMIPFLKYNGVKKIDYWFISHFDLDHYSGFLECVEVYPVENVVVAKNVYRDEAFDEVMGELNDMGINVIFLDTGDEIVFDKTNIKCLGPGDELATPDRNARSLALEYYDGELSFYFAGDIGIDEEKALLNSISPGSADIYKASHHGSNTSNSDEILDALSPKAAIISAGKNNRYHHPGEETLQRLKERNIDYYITAEMGQMTIKKKGDDIMLIPFLSK